MPSSRKISRRGVIGVAAAAAITGTTVALGGWKVSARPIIARGSETPQTARVELRIPPLAESRVEADGTRVFEIAAQAGTTDFGGGSTTPTWGYNGSFGGPTLRATNGERVRVHVTNELDEVTTAHWHGMKLPAKADGGPHQPIAPGDTWVAEWTVEQPAATLWYHPHNHGTTEAHVYRGLSGLFIVDDAGDAAVSPLPHAYGVDDVPVMLTDRSFTADGEFDESRRDAAGMLGDTILVNGTVAPKFTAMRAETRLRVLNGSPARSYKLQLDTGSMLLVGTDSGLLPEPVEVGSVTLTPGERAELLVSIDAGDSATLCSVPHTLGLLGSTERSSGTQDTFEILVIDRTEASADASTVPPFAERLAAAGGTLAAPFGPGFPTDYEPDERRTVTIQNKKLNYRRMNMNRIDDVVTVGALERWFITNEHFLPHNLHIHNARFLIRSIGGKEPAAELRGWKDTVYAPPSRTVVIDVEYGTSSDPHLPYMYHCHLLQHEDAGMMAQFVMVQPGEEAGPIHSPAIHNGGDHGDH